MPSLAALTDIIDLGPIRTMLVALRRNLRVLGVRSAGGRGQRPLGATAPSESEVVR